MEKLKWGFIGCGAIAKAFAHGIGQTECSEIVAVASPVDGEAEAFAKEHGIGASYLKTEDLLADRNVEAVYICTPHTHHARLSIAAALTILSPSPIQRVLSLTPPSMAVVSSRSAVAIV